MLKKLIAVMLTLSLIMICCLACASGSWGQINQEITRNGDWQRYVRESPYTLGEAGKTENADIAILDYGNYLSIDGSTVCVPMAMEIARQLLNMPESDLNGFVNFSTTHYAYERLISGSPNPDVTVLSRNAMMDDTCPVTLFLGTAPSDEEWAMAETAGVELKLVPVCYDAFVFLVNGENEIEGLTQEQIRGIYSGRVTNWTEVGGSVSAAIKAYQRPKNSGSQTAMENMVMQGGEVLAEPNFISDGMGDLVSQVGNYDNGFDALGYSYLYYVNELYQDGSLKVLSVDGVEPTAENLQSGAYPYTVNYYAVYRADDAAAEAFVQTLLSDEMQAAFAQAGYIPMK